MRGNGFAGARAPRRFTPGRRRTRPVAEGASGVACRRRRATTGTAGLVDEAAGTGYGHGMEATTARDDSPDSLARRMAALGVREEDIEETFVRSGGHGGQNVNKTSTCVQLVHRPTGLMVKCQTTRHQAVNRELARELLIEKLEARRAARVAAERARVEKRRRQKRPRSRAAKERMLADKARLAAKKRFRRVGKGDD